MARIWESSVVIGLRDTQWKYATPRAQFPDEYVSLDGNAERALGDGLLAVRERYFLFEVKSTRKEVSEEWARDTGRKRALLALDYALNALPNDEANRNLQRSMQGHFFAYWPTQRSAYSTVEGSILMESYLGAVHRKRGFSGQANVDAEKLVAVMGLGGSWSHKHLWEEVDSDITRYEVTAAHMAMTGKAKFVVESAVDLSWDHLGLPLDDFQAYVNFLMEKSGKAKSVQEPINAVVMSTTGSFFSHITNTSQLAKLFKPHSDGMTRFDDKGRPIRPARFAPTSALASTRSLKS